MVDPNNYQFSLENVESILHQFYHDVQSQVQANNFLMMAQLSPEAWNFSWQLLHPSKPQEVQFFGASTLQVKISKHWNEVPSDRYDALRKNLMDAIINYASGPKIILTRLFVALSSYIIHTITDFWPSAVSDLMSAFQPQNVPSCNTQKLTQILLELLTVLYEEFQTTCLSSAKVGGVQNSLRIAFLPVIGVIENILSQPDVSPDLCEIAIKCYSSWSILGTDVFEYESVLMLIFDCVYKPEISQTALETLSNLALHISARKYPNYILKMMRKIVTLDGLLLKAIQEDDQDTCNSIYAVVIALADHHSSLVLDTILEKSEEKDTILKLISFILQCSGTPGQYPVDEICSEQAFGFWYTLQDSIKATDPPKFESLLLTFHPIFHSLVDTYLLKARYPPDEVFRQWNTDEQEAFRCYRQDIGDSCMYCYNILQQAMLANLMAHLSIATTTAINDPSQWQYLEACLFAFKEVSESVDIEEDNYVPQFISQLPNIPMQHLKVISAAMEAVGSYAEWINVHPDIMGCVIPLLLMGLLNAEVAPSASFALKDITRDCHSCLLPFVEQILFASQEAFKESILKSRERVRLMGTVGQVLSIMPFDYIMSYLNSLLSPMIDQLQQLISEKSFSKNGSAIVLHIHLLSTLFSTLDIKSKETDRESDDGKEHSKLSNVQPQTPQPVLLVLQKVMPIFTALGTSQDISEQIAEALCDALKRAISTLLEDCQILVPEMLQLILHLFKCCPHYTVLDVAKQMLLLFVNDNSQKCQLSSFFAAICNHTLEISHKDFRENTIVLEIFLQLLSQVIKKAFLFFKDEAINLPIIFQCGIAALSLPEKPTVRAASSFLTEFIVHSREVPNMLNIVNNQGETLVCQVLKVIGGDSPRAVVEHMPDILMALNKKYFDNLCRWMSAFVQQEGFPSHRVNQAQKEQFTRLVLKERTNKRKLKETVNEFCLLSRGLFGTEYAAQSVSLA